MSFLSPAHFIWLQYCRNHMSSKRVDRSRAEPFSKSQTLKIIGMFVRKRIYKTIPKKVFFAVPLPWIFWLGR